VLIFSSLSVSHPPINMPFCDCSCVCHVFGFSLHYFSQLVVTHDEKSVDNGQRLKLCANTEAELLGWVEAITPFSKRDDKVGTSCGCPCCRGIALFTHEQQNMSC
jgi:hypothetical protein